MSWLTRLFGMAMERGKEREEAVAIAQIALGLDPPKKEMSPEALWAVIVTNTCPDCKGTGFLEGPSGGLSTNIYCATCGHRFNVTPVVRRAVRI